MTLEEALKFGIEQLKEASIENPDIDAWYLLEMVSHINRTYYYMHLKDEIDQEHLVDYKLAIAKRKERIPLQYITGEQEFMGLKFLVNENVLIPRQDTELLVEMALKYCEGKKKVLDLCTGSGCILISLLKNLPHLQGTGSDISKGALLVAKENAKRNEVVADWVRSDMFGNINEKFDVIVSNPPYIETAEIEKLMPEVRDFEPRTALDGDEDGLKFYREIIEHAGEYLQEDGYLLLEIGCNQGIAVCQLMKQAGFENVSVHKDLAQLDRVVIGKGKKNV